MGESAGAAAAQNQADPGALRRLGQDGEQQYREQQDGFQGSDHSSVCRWNGWYDRGRVWRAKMHALNDRQSLSVK